MQASFFLACRTGVAVVLLTALLGMVLAACDGGLKPPPPEPPQTTISGTITYKGGRAAWLPADSVVTVRIAAFTSLPSATSGIAQAILSGSAYFSPSAFSLDSSLTKFADSTRYQIIVTNPVPAQITYLAVVVLVDPAALTNQLVLFSPRSWRVVGVYSTTGDNTKPSAITLQTSQDHKTNVTVDFKNLPPQPF